MTYGQPQEWHDIVNGLEYHLWAQRALRIKTRYRVARDARLKTQGFISEDERWEILRWAAHREEQGT